MHVEHGEVLSREARRRAVFIDGRRANGERARQSGNGLHYLFNRLVIPRRDGLDQVARQCNSGRHGKALARCVAETHGRAETDALLSGLETVSKKSILYRDKSFAEMDLDGLLARRPKLAIIDELAHTNVPGSRHTKRYQDVEEVLA